VKQNVVAACSHAMMFFFFIIIIKVSVWVNLFVPRLIL
jgi:hypothetical protein